MVGQQNFKYNLKRKLCWLTILVIFTVGGCSIANLPNVQILNCPKNSITKVAVLPFKNNSKFLQGGDLFYKVFSAKLINSHWVDVCPEGDIRAIYRQLEIFPGQQPNLQQLRIIASRLHVEYLILGKVLRMEEKRTRQGEINPIIAVSLQIVNGRTGKVILVTHHYREGESYRKIMHFGMVDTVTKLAAIMSSEIIEQWERDINECVRK